MNPPPRRLYAPHRAQVSVGPGGVPVEVDSVGVETVREEWLVEDRWWTEQPLRRRYFELVLVDGRDVVVFEAEDSASWFAQRA